LEDKRPPRVEIVEISQDGKVIYPTGGRVVVDRPNVRIVTRAEAVGPSRIVRMYPVLGDTIFFQKAEDVDRQLKHTATWDLELSPGVHKIQVGADNEHFAENVSQEIFIEYKGPSRPSLYVLAIGVSEYQYAKPLQFAHSDAASFARTVKHGAGDWWEQVETKVVANSQATRSGIEDGIQWLAARMSSSDGRIQSGNVGIIFFAGHGFHSGQFYLAPIDARRENLEGTCVSAEMIRQVCHDVGGNGKLMVLLDACYSGALDLKPLAEDLRANRVLVMASSTGQQRSWEDPQWQAGAFTKVMIDGLEGQADTANDRDVFVDHAELSLYVRQVVPQLVAELSRQRFGRTPGDEQAASAQQNPIVTDPGFDSILLTKVLESSQVTRADP
jgi:hypothetical protein